MTLRDKVALYDPTAIQPECKGGVIGCPSHYSFLHIDEVACEKQSTATCEACWTREFVEEGESEMEAVEYRPCESCEAYKKEIEECKKKIEEFRSLLDDKEREIAALRGKNDRLTDKVNTLWDTNYHYELVIKTVEALIGKNIISADYDD